jgi:glutamate synthase domain-containing protein 2
MFALGCIQALQCNKNTCPTGVTTHDKRLQRGLNVPDKSARVHHYHDKVVNEVCMIAHSCGLPEPRLLRRRHARITTASGISLPLSEYYERWKKGEEPALDARPSTKLRVHQ